MLKAHHFLIILHFAIIHALEVILLCLYDGITPHSVFIPWALASATNLGIIVPLHLPTPRNLVAKHLPAHQYPYPFSLVHLPYPFGH